MNELTVKEKILMSLLESPKTTGDIAKSLGPNYVDKKGHGRYNMVKGDLNTLQSWGFVKQQKEKKPGIPGPAPTVYYIVFDLYIIKEILKKYPSLVFYLQKNDDFIDSTIQKNAHMQKMISSLSREEAKLLKELFRKMLKTSPTFFKYSFNDSFIHCRNLWLRRNRHSVLNDNAVDLKVLVELFDSSKMHDFLSGNIDQDYIIEQDSKFKAFMTVDDTAVTVI